MIIPRRILLVFDDRPRPETTGTYVRRAFDRMLAQGDIDAVRHVRPDEISQLGGDIFDLVVVVDDGLDDPLPDGLGPVVYWAIDTHIDFDRSLARSRQADFVFTAQKDGAERLRQAGIASARWLPLACDPRIHAKHDVPKERDLCFVGNVFPGPRADLLRLLQQVFPGMYVGNAYFDDMARLYSSSKIVFNRSVGNDVNMRVFEALASGSLLITNDLAAGNLGGNGQPDLFRDGIHLATYRTGEELLDKARYYLRRDDLRERIAAAGRAEVLAKHCYDHRVRDWLSVAGRTGGVSPLFVTTVPGVPRSGIRENSDADAAGIVPVPLKVTGDRLQGTAGSGQEGVASTRTRRASKAGPRSGLGDVPTRSVGTSAWTHRPDRSYFGHARRDIASLVPLDARTVCEVGCGHGLTGALLKQRQPCEVIGIELDPEAAAVARTRLDLVLGTCWSTSPIRRRSCPAFAAGSKPAGF